MTDSLRLVIFIPLFVIMVGLCWVLYSLLRLLGELERQKAQYRGVCKQATGQNYKNSCHGNHLVRLAFHFGRNVRLLFRKLCEKFGHVRHLDTHGIGMAPRSHSVENVRNSLVHNSTSNEEITRWYETDRVGTGRNPGRVD